MQKIVKVSPAIFWQNYIQSIEQKNIKSKYSTIINFYDVDWLISLKATPLID
jgi:hypothetical protein